LSKGIQIIFESIEDHIAFYAQKMDGCYVDDEKVCPQPGLFYGGWVTDDIVGPIKGVPGSEGWQDDRYWV